MNLGAGGRHDLDWIHVDRAGEVDVTHDLTELPLPFADESCEAVALHHVLDLLPADRIQPLLRDVKRILYTGRWVRISSADIDLALDHAGDLTWFPEPKDTLAESLDWFVTQGGARQTPLTVERLRGDLKAAGFRLVIQTPAGETSGPAWLTDLDDRAAESFFVEAS